MIDIDKYYYDRYLMSCDKNFDTSLFLNYSNTKQETTADEEDIPKKAKRDKQDEKDTLAVIRYAFDFYLRWPPEYTMDHISVSLLKKIKLYDLATKRINYPPELTTDNSPWLYYLVCQMYPEKFTYDATSAVESFYKVFLTTQQRTKTIFDSTPEGKKRAAICLLYALRDDGISSSAEAYQKFLGHKVKPWLLKYKLLSYYTENYTHPIEFLHDALPRTEENEREYRMAKFLLSEKENVAKHRKSKPSST